MREIFRGFYRPTSKEFKQMWSEALFVPDASFLLNIYRYSAPARKQLLQTLRSASDRLWVPYQAALEFQRNRLSVIQKQKDMHADLQKELEKVQAQLESKATELRRHPVLEPEVVLKHLNNFTNQLDKYLAKHREPYPFKADLFEDDPIRQELTNVIGNQVGRSMSEDELGPIMEGAKRRFEKRIPPGFLDADKDEDRRYGDLILWHEVMQKAREVSKPVIFVTDDEKEDWWWRFKGHTLGPRPELVQEIYEHASVPMYMYNSLRFIEEARGFFQLEVSDETLQEIGTVREMRIREASVERPGGSKRPGASLSQRLFSRAEAELVCVMRPSDLDYWIEHGQVEPITTGDGSLMFRYRDLVALRALHEVAVSAELPMDIIDELADEIKRLVLRGRSGWLVVMEGRLAQVPTDALRDTLQDLEEPFTLLNVREVIRSVRDGIEAFG
jgi:hypothetical protein